MHIRHSLIAAGLLLSASGSLAAEGKLVPEIHFLTWPAARYQQFFETSNYMAEKWRELGLKVRLDPVAYPNPMLAMWFRDHQFDVVLSSLSAAPHRFEPDFFTNAQFNSKNVQPGDWNVGEYKNPRVDELGRAQLGVYDRNKRREIILELQKVLADDPPEIVINYISQAFPINTSTVAIDDYQNSPEGVRANQNVLRMKAKNGNAVRIGWTVSYTTFNPFVANTLADAEMVALIYDRLLWIGGDGTPELMLAKSINVVNDTTIDVTIRPGHTFSDGKPVTAEDVKFSFEYLKKWEAVSLKSYLSRVASVEVVGGDTVRFTLSEPYAPFIMHTLGQIYILPKHVWATVVEDKGLKRPQEFANTNPVGSGPYTLKYNKEGQEVYLAKRTDHFARPQSDILHIAFGSAEVLAQTLRKGDIDVSFQPLVPAAVEEFSSVKNIKIYNGYSNGIISARFKTTGPVFWNRDLRRALVHATPYEQINQDIYNGQAKTSASAITPMNPFWHNASLESPRLDMAKARQILEDAGFTWDKDGALRFPPTN
jgi:peptide/nickel transport system substrate-binding protein